MKWAMTDDYAALITAIILAVLLIGTVQTYSFMQKWTQTYVSRLRETYEAYGRIAAAVEEGSEPRPEDLESLRNRVLVVLRIVSSPAYWALGLWGATCGWLVWTQIRVLRWAGTHHPAADPDLAQEAFAVCCFAIGVLVLEGLVRAMLQAVRDGHGAVLPYLRMSRAARTRANEALRAHRRSVRSRSAEPGTGQ